MRKVFAALSVVCACALTAAPAVAMPSSLSARYNHMYTRMLATPLCQAVPVSCQHAKFGYLGGKPALLLGQLGHLDSHRKTTANIACGYGACHTGQQRLRNVVGAGPNYNEWLCMTDNGDTSFGAYVKVSWCNSSTNQTWNTWWNGAGWMLENIAPPARCANDQYGSAATYTRVNLWTCDTSSSRQTWDVALNCMPGCTYGEVMAFTPWSDRNNAAISMDPRYITAGYNVWIQNGYPVDQEEYWYGY